MSVQAIGLYLAELRVQIRKFSSGTYGLDRVMALPRDDVASVAATYSIERAKIAPLLQQLASAGAGAALPPELQAIRERRCDPMGSVVQRIVVTIT